MQFLLGASVMYWVVVLLAIAIVTVDGPLGALFVAICVYVAVFGRAAFLRRRSRRG
jgi:hypothetical protein